MIASPGGGFGSRIFRMTKSKTLLSIASLVYPPTPFLNVIPKNCRRDIHAAIFCKGYRVLDVGSGITKGPGDWLWTASRDPSVTIVRLDIIDGPGIDIVADATDLPDIGKFDAVVLQSVPEHVRDIGKLFKSIKAVLKTGGIIYVEMPFLQGVHGDPYDFWRCTLDGLETIIGSPKVVLKGVSGGPIGALIWIVSDLVSNITPYKTINFLLRFIVRWVLAVFRYLDFILYKTQASQRLACEYYILSQNN